MRPLVVLAALCGPSAWGLTLPDRPLGPVSDFASALRPDQVARLTAQLKSYEVGTTRQIAVAIFRSLDGESPEDVSIRLAERWKIGGKKESDGVLLSVFLDDHKMRIEVGYGLEGKLPDAVTTQIQREVIAPRLRAGDLEGALRAGVGTLDTLITGRPHAGETVPISRRSRGQSPAPVSLVLFLLFVALSIWLNWRRRGGFFIGGGGGGWSGGGGGWSSGGGGESGGGGGWSGGGGSFGGGGSTGSW